MTKPTITRTALKLIDAVGAGHPLSDELRRLPEIRVPALIAYQNTTYARRYITFVQQVAAAERAGSAGAGQDREPPELPERARRLDDRLCSIERIMTAENPNWRQQCLPEQRSQRLLIDGE